MNALAVTADLLPPLQRNKPFNSFHLHHNHLKLSRLRGNWIRHDWRWKKCSVDACGLPPTDIRNTVKFPTLCSHFSNFQELRSSINGEKSTTSDITFYKSLIIGASEHVSRSFSTSEEERTLESNIYGGFKFIFLLGLLCLQCSQSATAGTEIAAETLPFSLIGDVGDISTGFVSAFLLIFFSELGDKTFFIAALLAARNSGVVIFTGTFGALAAMTVISVVLGRVFHYVDGVLPFRFGGSDLPIDDIAAVFLLVYFGVSTLLDAASGGPAKADEEQKEAELAISKLSGNGAGILSAANTVISTFLLVFIAEWGDKSFFSTIALAAASSPFGVIGGALAGHAVATLIAVLGGSLLGSFLSEKVIAYVGGSLFLVFAVLTLAEIVK